MQIRVKLAAVLLVAACGGTKERVVVNPVTYACETGSAPSRYPARRLAAMVATLDQAPRTDDHVALHRAMRALGDALEQIAPERTAELARVRTMTQALERAVGNPDARADFVRIGLVSAWHALEAAAPRNARSSCYQTGLDAMIASSSQIAPELRLAAQYDHVRAALHAASATVIAAEGGTVATRR